MKISLFLLAALCVAAPALADDVFDHVDDALTFGSDQDAVRARVSGTLDLEGYEFQQPAPAFMVSSGNYLFQPRLSLFLDAQVGQYIYVFAQSRTDRGFDPSNQDIRMRLDEYAVRITPWSDGRFNLQLGKFASVVGNWNPRHLSWDNPFITAPLAYEYLTGVWDILPAKAASTLALWANVGPKPSTTFPIKTRSLPILWGPSYATGASVSGALGSFDYAMEVKNASLSSRPQTWDIGENGFRDPTVSGRIGYRPDTEWNFGVSASTGDYLLNNLPPADFPSGYTLHNYREIVLGQDAAWLWRDWETWAEVYEARFQVPKVGNADTVSYYVEERYKLDAHWFLSARWNQQVFSTLPNGNNPPAEWGSNIWRIDLGPTYRFTAHSQLKLQYSFQREDVMIGPTNHILAAQFTVRF
jgi:hypothetical protein